ncbi:MAG TPA: FAD-dependent oxidoreductase [Oscillospiraceae bacterium]|nr:FAD-dependent oxidoreductase [Oscillospiraceae bacterium]HPF55875.1 FAD-dependent oxidoreductase [Clostridiales bacterium]HPK35172.1 FAD-dependent oxidoreductase [Oscillospiraceae bacterium]HPR74975.1 FAD-dependent oxidoreductase [Oscillospiraceae bacterium]
MNRKSLFEPMKIGKVEIKNKISMAPMGAFGLINDDGSYNQRAVDYYVERAKGGAGLLITSITKVENEIDKTVMPAFPCATTNPIKFIETSSEMTERVHAYGAKIFLQLTMGFGRTGASVLMAKHPVSASAIPNYWDPTVTCRALTTAEVESIVEKFGEAAQIAKMSGYDGVEIHAVHEGYLLDQFTLAIFNRRTDKYGGDLRGRLTLPIEIVQTIKKTVGADFPVGLRYSVKSAIKDWRQGGLPDEDYQEKGRDLAEGLEAAKILEAAGYDELNTDVGTYDAWYWAHPPVYQKHGLYLPYTKELKKVVKIPVIVAGKLDIPDLAVKALEDGSADMIGIARGLLADPEWPKKAMEGRDAEIRPCIGCHTGCLGRAFEAKPLSCAVNPAVGRERYYEMKPAEVPKKVLIIGGGIAGMEVARVAKTRGHQILLFEKTNKLGGHVIPGSKPDFKLDDRRLLDWYINQMKLLKVDIRMNTAATEETVKTEHPDVVVVATGSNEVIPNIPGIDRPNVFSATEVLNGTKKAGNKVVVVGGGLVGCETALWLSNEGKDVTIVEMLDDIVKSGSPVPHMNRIMLIDLIKQAKIQVITKNSLLEVKENGVTVIDRKFKRCELPCDSVIIAVGFKSDNGLFKDLNGKYPELYIVGDAFCANNIQNAVWTANEVGLHV